jgi:hypothetical protein
LDLDFVSAYCLMTNHFHLLLEIPDANLSKKTSDLGVSPSAPVTDGKGFTSALGFLSPSPQVASVNRMAFSHFSPNLF